MLDEDVLLCLRLLDFMLHLVPKELLAALDPDSVPSVLLGVVV